MRSVVAVAWLGVWACVLTPVATTLCSYVAAVYWALVTLTSVGYGDISAVTNLGRSPCGGDLVAPWTMSNVLAAWHRDGVLNCGHGSWLVVGGFHCWQHHVHRRVAGPCFGEKAPAHRRRGEVDQVRRLYISCVAGVNPHVTVLVAFVRTCRDTKHLPESLQLKLHSWAEGVVQHSRAGHTAVVRQLPESLRHQVVYYMWKPTIEKSNMLRVSRVAMGDQPSPQRHHSPRDHTWPQHVSPNVTTAAAAAEFCFKGELMSFDAETYVRGAVETRASRCADLACAHMADV